MYRKLTSHVDTDRVAIFTEHSRKEIPYKAFRFSAGEIQVRIECDTLLELSSMYGISYIIRMDFQSSDDVMLACLLADALRNVADNWSGRDVSKATVILECPYFPYGRQDRVCYEGEASSARVFARMLGTAFDSITTWDAHSTNALSGLTVPVRTVSIEPFIRAVARQYPFKENLILVQPDAGSWERVQKARTALGRQHGVLKMDKTRDPETGALSGFAVSSDHGSDYKNSLPENPQFFIIDDLLDGGGTFLGILRVLTDLRPKAEVLLYITHGIFSKGFELFDGTFDRIFVANLMASEEDICRSQGLPSYVRVIDV